jgi:hypothetical protein
MQGVSLALASILGEERRCLQILKKSNATSAKAALGLTEISDMTKFPLDRVEPALQRLITRGKVGKTEDNKYYAKCEDKKHC